MDCNIKLKHWCRRHGYFVIRHTLWLVYMRWTLCYYVHILHTRFNNSDDCADIVHIHRCCLIVFGSWKEISPGDYMVARIHVNQSEMTFLTMCQPCSWVLISDLALHRGVAETSWLQEKDMTAVLTRSTNHCRKTLALCNSECHGVPNASITESSLVQEETLSVRLCAHSIST